MPKSRNTRKGRKPKKPKTRRMPRPGPPPPPRMATESLFHQMGLGGVGQSDGERDAQALVFEAWETPEPRERAARARKALELWPDCADAWVILAQDMADTLLEAHEFYAEGVSAGERALGKEVFEEDVGHFWGILETRPYMRARLGLAQVLRHMGEIDEAAGHLRDLLCLNPGDNQGNRYVLLHLLLEAGRDAEAAELLAEYPDDAMAEWKFARALVSFRQTGVGGESDQLLARALQANGFVAAYLLGRRPIPRQLPTSIGFGDNNEAIAYAVDYKAIWKQTPGALAWLKAGLGP